MAKLDAGSTLKRLRNRYRLVVMNDDTYEEVVTFKLSRLSVYIGLSTIFVVLIGLTVALIVFTPLKYYIPGYDDLKVGREYRQMKYRVDSLERQVDYQAKYIDNFKKVNDQYGHAIGDDVLVETAHRLEYAVRPGDSVSRFSGDEFGILLDRVHDDITAEAITKRIMAQFLKPFLHQSGSLQVTISIGISLFSHQYETPEEMVRSADDAMYVAKNGGKSRYQFAAQQPM